MQEFNLNISKLFNAIGHEPTTSLVTSQVQINLGGYILTIWNDMDKHKEGVCCGCMLKKESPWSRLGR